MSQRPGLKGRFVGHDLRYCLTCSTYEPEATHRPMCPNGHAALERVDYRGTPYWWCDDCADSLSCPECGLGMVSYPTGRSEQGLAYFCDECERKSRNRVSTPEKPAVARNKKASIFEPWNTPEGGKQDLY
jgi:hypothetical protein